MKLFYCTDRKCFLDNPKEEHRSSIVEIYVNQTELHKIINRPGWSIVELCPARLSSMSEEFDFSRYDELKEPNDEYK